jgi:hypothetical protein
MRIHAAIIGSRDAPGKESFRLSCVVSKCASVPTPERRAVDDRR